MIEPFRAASAGSSKRYAHASFSPSTDVPSLVNWWRADTNTIGTGVSQLTDKKGSVNLTQGTGANQPTYNAADGNYNGRDTISFNGTSHALTVASPGIGTMSAVTIYLVIGDLTPPASTTDYVLAIGNVADNSSIQITAAPTTGSLRFRWRGVPAPSASSWQIPMSATGAQFGSSGPTVFSCAMRIGSGGANVFNATTPKARMGEVGTFPESASVGGSLANQAMGLGATKAGTAQWVAFKFCELMICSAIHTPDQMLRTNLYLSGYYGII